MCKITLNNFIHESTSGNVVFDLIRRHVWSEYDSPGDLWALPDSQQNGLSVNEDGPAGETGQEQN